MAGGPKRTRERYQSFTPTYRQRLARRGIGEEEYLSGVSLSAARGQSKESYRKWKRRAKARGIDAESFDDAVESEGLETVKRSVISIEHLHREWVDSGQPNKTVRSVLRQEGLYDIPESALDLMHYMATHYGDNWGYYH